MTVHTYNTYIAHNIFIGKYLGTYLRYLFICALFYGAVSIQTIQD
jgi:hypothetical protein